jgi:predicted amidohydrolase YtcJ
MKTTLFQARKIITMNPSRPLATHVAVRDDRILGTGALEELAGWGPYELDSRLAAKVLMPGLVEGHSQPSDGRWFLALRLLRLIRAQRPRRQAMERREVARCGAAAPERSAGCAARCQHASGRLGLRPDLL